jgi:hypothetical protein
MNESKIEKKVKQNSLLDNYTYHDFIRVFPEDGEWKVSTVNYDHDEKEGNSFEVNTDYHVNETDDRNIYRADILDDSGRNLHPLPKDGTRYSSYYVQRIPKSKVARTRGIKKRHPAGVVNVYCGVRGVHPVKFLSSVFLRRELVYAPFTALFAAFDSIDLGPTYKITKVRASLANVLKNFEIVRKPFEMKKTEMKHVHDGRFFFPEDMDKMQCQLISFQCDTGERIGLSISDFNSYSGRQSILTVTKLEEIAYILGLVVRWNGGLFIYNINISTFSNNYSLENMPYYASLFNMSDETIDSTYVCYGIKLQPRDCYSAVCWNKYVATEYELYGLKFFMPCDDIFDPDRSIFILRAESTNFLKWYHYILVAYAYDQISNPNNCLIIDYKAHATCVSATLHSVTNLPSDLIQIVCDYSLPRDEAEPHYSIYSYIDAFYRYEKRFNVFIGNDVNRELCVKFALYADENEEYPKYVYGTHEIRFPVGVNRESPERRRITCCIPVRIMEIFFEGDLLSIISLRESLIF